MIPADYASSDSLSLSTQRFICLARNSSSIWQSFPTFHMPVQITQAILVAAVCEFLGAMLLGAGVTDTIRSNIANVSLYTKSPALLLYGMFCVQIAAAFW